MGSAAHEAALADDATATDAPGFAEPDPPLPRRSRWGRPLIGPFSVGHVALLAIVLVVAVPLLLLLSLPITPPEAARLPIPGSGFYQLGEPTTGLAIGQRAPELEGTDHEEVVALRDLDGGVIRLADRRGGPVWLSFFATWCPPCQEETPVLRAAHERYGPLGLSMIAVSVQETTAEDVRSYARRYELGYTIGFDATSAVFRAYHGFGLPTHVFLDSGGIIRQVRYGPVTLPEVERIVVPLL